VIIPRPMSPDLVMRVPGGINPTPVPNGTSREESTIETTERRRRDSKIERKKRRKEKKRDERRALREASAKRSDEGHEPPPLGPRGREWRPAIEPGGEACRDAAGACRLSLVPPAHRVERGSRRATWAEGSREGRRGKASSRGLLLRRIRPISWSDMALPDDADCARDCPPGPSSNGVEKNPREDRAGGATTPRLLQEIDRDADSSRPLLPTLPPTSEP